MVVGAGAGVEVGLEAQCAVIFQSVRSTHQISAGEGRRFVHGDRRALLTLENVSVTGSWTEVVRAWENGYDGLSE